MLELKLPLPVLTDNKIRAVLLALPVPLSEDDWAYMLMLLDTMKPALVVSGTSETGRTEQ